MNENPYLKTSYRKRYPTVLPKEDFKLYEKWHTAKYTKKQFFVQKQMEKQLRTKGYGYLIGDIPSEEELSKEHRDLILQFRKLRNLHDYDASKEVAKTLRKLGLGAFGGEFISQEKPPLKDRVLSDENIVAFTNATQCEVLGFLDTEFTTRRHEILSIGCVLYDTTTKRTYEFYKTCRPIYEKKVSPYCLELTGLTQEEIDDSPSFETTIQQFKDFLDIHGGSYLMTWGNSDVGSMKTSFSFNHLNLKLKKDICDRITDIQPIISISRDDTRSQFSLQDMLDYYNITREVKHHALQDAHDLKDILLNFMQKYN